MKVKKRNRDVVEYDIEKIACAVAGPFQESGEDFEDVALLDSIDEHVRRKAKSGVVSVEEIQDVVEDELIYAGYLEEAKSYIKYRYDHSKERERQRRLEELIEQKIRATNVQNQNANVDEKSFGGRVGEASDAVMKDLALRKYVSPMARRNHENNEIYIHDLNSYPVGSHNCTDGSGWVIIKDADGEIKNRKVADFANEIGIEDGQIANLEKSNFQILSRDGWTKLNSITKRRLEENEGLYTIKTRTGLPLKLTAHHRLPVLKDGEETLKEVKDLEIGDELISADNILLSVQELNQSFINLSEINCPDLDIRIFNLTPLKSYLRFKYGLVYENWASQNCKYWKGRTSQTMALEDFHMLLENYPLSFEILSQLKIAANGSKHKYPLLIPFSPELAKLYAYIYSDGSVYVNQEKKLYQASFANTNEDIIDDFIYCFESCFGRKLNKCYPSEEYATNNSPCIRVHCGDKIITQIFYDFGNGLMEGSGNLKIPDFIMNGPKEVKYAYLSAAIDSDGCISNHNTNITTCCRDYAEQLVIILKSLGYHATITKKDEKGSSYRFNKSSRTGIRNFDSYKINLYRDKERADLHAHMSTIKYVEGSAFQGISSHFIESKIVSIIEMSGLDSSVYDFETASHWFILNNYISHNCLSIPFDDLLANGFNTRQTDVRPANSINTAMQLVAVIFQLQSLVQFGGCSATHLDWTMVPYVKKSFYKHYLDGLKYLGSNYHYDWNDTMSIDDENYKKNCAAYQYAMDKTEQETHQAVEGMFHNLNTLQSRSGNQLKKAAA